MPFSHPCCDTRRQWQAVVLGLARLRVAAWHHTLVFVGGPLLEFLRRRQDRAWEQLADAEARWLA